jgi:uncharacterized protein
MLTIEEVKNNGLLVFEAIVGSKAYGLSTEKSDTDIRGIFILPKELYYSLDYTPQVSNATNDIVYYELKRFIELLSKNNPNIIELLNVPNEFVLFRDSIMDYIEPKLFLSKLCENSFANYAFTQIKKAYGLEKKIVSPMDGERKSVLDFCYVYANSITFKFREFVDKNNYVQEKFGLSAITHLRDCFDLFYSTEIKYKGVQKSEMANDIALSSIPKGEKPIAILYFNKDAYSVHCKKYKSYWDWVEKRNEDRYNTTMYHGKRYDSKNMMHVFRLLTMAKEIALEGKVNVHRKDREFLLKIKNGEFEYDELVAKAELLKTELGVIYQNSNLPNSPDLDKINNILVKMRIEYYSR